MRKSKLDKHLSETKSLIPFVKQQMKTYPEMVEKVDKIYEMVDFLVNTMTVNGDDGSEPITGIKNILENEHNTNKRQSKDIGELRILTTTLRVKKKVLGFIQGVSRVQQVPEVLPDTEQMESGNRNHRSITHP